MEGEEVEVAGKKVLTACSPISMDAWCSEEGKVDKDNNLPSVESIDSWGDEGKFIPRHLFKIHSSQTDA